MKTQRLLPLALLLVACNTTPVAGPDAVGHAVVFELHDPAATARLDADLEALMRATPGVIESHVGPRCDVAVHDGINDTTFELLLWVSFVDEAALQAYIASEAHVALVEAWMPSIQGVQVYDAWVGR